jgi:hypothetical protein
MSDTDKTAEMLPPGHLTSFVMKLAAQGLAPMPLPPNGGRRMPLGWGPRDSLEAKYEARVVRNPEGCWGWIGAINPVSGYAYMGKRIAHRYSYERFVGPIPEGHTIDHLCRVHACTNPAHLEAVTQAENNRRAFVQATCKKGHPWTPATEYRSPATGRRSCRTCANAKMRRFYAARRAARKAAA